MILSPLMSFVTPPPIRFHPMCYTSRILQVPTNTPTIAGLTTSTKGAQSQLLQEAASKLEDRSLAEMGRQTYLKAVDEKVIPDSNNTWMDVKVRNHKLHTVDR